MLTYLNDKLVPRDIERIERNGFRDIVDLVGKSGGR
jgi:hypothetical protein